MINKIKIKNMKKLQNIAKEKTNVGAVKHRTRGNIYICMYIYIYIYITQKTTKGKKKVRINETCTSIYI